MKLNTLTLISGIILSAAFSGQISAKSHFGMNSAKPNVIIVVIDDMGWKQLGCYGSGFYNSPNIDKLAESGVRFTNAYSSAPVCSPTRAALMTGKYPARLHITDFIPGNKPNNETLIVPDWQKFLPLEEVTIAEIMKSAGYRTALFGKWHLSKGKFGEESLPNNPDKQGFDESFLTYKPSKDLPLGFWQKPELDGHSTDTITNRSIDFIRRNKANPFFLVVSFDAIHDPLMEHEAAIQEFRKLPESKQPENNPVLGAMIQRVDRAVGKLLNSIEQVGLTENTLLILISDNGGLVKSASQSPLKEGKGWLYEGGIRVPMIVSWKGKMKPGQETSQPVATIDLFPTLLDLTGIKNTLSEVDGISIVPALKNDGPLKRDALFWNYPHYHNGPPSAAIRKGNFKLIEWYEKSLTNQPGAFELFDLSIDPGEQKDLSKENPELTRQLKKELNEWRQDIGAQVPGINENFKKSN